jgi:hypothetical protein
MAVRISVNITHMRYLTIIACTLLLTCSTTVAQSQTPTDDELSTLNGKPMSILIRSRRFSESAEDPVNSLKNAKMIYVMSYSLLVGSAVVETKLQKRPEFKQLGLVITRDIDNADLILEVRHDVFAKYTYTAIDPRFQIVVASGKLSSLGGTVAGKVAKRFLKQVVKARS